MRDLDTEFVDHALEAGWITDRDQRRAQRAVAKARKRGRSLYVSQALVQQGALSCDQLLELGRTAQARLYECPRCGHKVSADAVPAPGEPFSCGRCERELEADQEQTLSLAEVLTSRDPLDLSVTLRERDPREASGSTSASSLPPFDLSRFELHEELGRGAYGVVFRATQTDLEREVALKVLRPREGELSPVALERFLREGASVARLQHPNVVRVFGIGRHKDLFVLSMELVPGESLKAFRKRHPEGRLPWKQAVEIVRGVLAGVEHAHKHGVIHRDLKPANVLIEADGARPRVIDFGLAKDLETDAQLTQGSAAVGSPAYLSPEQLKHGSSQADERCDVFSVGVMLYELLSATRPWTAKTRNDLFLTMLKDPPAPLPASLDLPGGLTSVVMRMLAQDPQARFASAAEARDALGALEAGDAEPTPEPQAAAPRAARTRKAPRTAARPAVGGRSPLPWILGGAGALLVLALALTQLGSSPPAEPQVADAPPAQQPELPAEPEPAPEPELLGVPEPQEPPIPAEPEPSEPEAPVEPPVEAEPVAPLVEVEPADAPVAVLAEPDPVPAQEAPEPPAPAPPTEALYAVVREAEALNLRSGPGTSFGVVRVAKLGEWLRASGEVRSGWQELELADGRRAWASSRFLELTRVPLAVDPSRPELDTGEGDAQRFPTLAAHDHETQWYERAFEINRLVDGALTAHVLSGLRLALKDPRPLNRAFALRGLRRYPRELLLGVGSQGLVEGLIEQLGEVHEAFVPKVAAELLGRLAGDDEARDAEGWQTWWREHGEAEARELARGPLPVPAALTADGGTRVRELSGAVSRVRKQGLDVVFLLDVTKSMGEELQTVKSQVREIVSLLSLLLDTKKVRLGFVAYGDEVVDWQYLIPPARFPERLDEVQIFDDPKDATIEEGISVALRATFDKRMRWGKSKRRRVVLLLADAPPLDPDLCRQIVQAAARQDFVLSSLIAEPPDYAKHKPADAILTELAKLGGGEVAPLSSPEELLVHILTLAFGPDYVQDLRLLVRAYRDVRPQRVE